MTKLNKVKIQRTKLNENEVRGLNWIQVKLEYVIYNLAFSFIGMKKLDLDQIIHPNSKGKIWVWSCVSVCKDLWTGQFVSNPPKL